jgi:prepilin-type N-terminal cleavage/methylation domain-containing protein
MTVVRRQRSQRGITLVELLVAMSIMLVLSTLIVGTWLALSNAYSFTTRSDKQRDMARQAIERMGREIRDAQEPSSGASLAFVKVDPFEVQFYSTFNTADAPSPSSPPRLSRFIYRVTDADAGTGSIYREFPGPDGSFDTGDDVSQLMVSHISNDNAGRDMFTYWAYGSGGVLVAMDGDTVDFDPSRIATVELTLLVDLNPGKAPNYMDLTTVVQPRNVRQF